MSKRDYLQENIDKLLENTEPELSLPKGKKHKIMAKLIEEADALSSESTISVLKDRILKSKIATLATAAVLILAVILGTMLFNVSVSSAYAFEQTIGALQNVTTVHVIGTNWDDNRFEAWNKINPETGKAEWVCIDETPHGNKIASTPKGSCIWDANGTVVKLTNRIISTNDFRYSHVFKELSERTSHPRDDEQITVYREKEPASGKEFIVISAVTKLKDYKIYIDPVTKLPVRTIYDRADNMQQICKTADQIFYNVELPEGMFDFEIPEEFVRDYSVLEAPNKGMSAEGLTHEEASVLIAEKYWKAATLADWDMCQQLAPLDRSWNTGFRRNPPVELIEVKQPYPERGCSGLIVPCIVRYKDGKVKDSKAVVNYRQINDQPSVIIVAWWGKPRLIQ